MECRILYCKNETVEGTKSCQYHIDKKREVERAINERKIANNECRTYNCKNTRDNGIYCKSCSDVRAIKYKERVSKRKNDGVCVNCNEKNDKLNDLFWCPECILIKKIYRKELYDYRVINKLCVKCESPVIENTTFCKSCTEKKSKVSKFYNRKWRVKTFSDATLCNHSGCKNPTVNGYKCEYHLYKDKEGRSKRKENLIKNKKCVRCAKPLIDDGFSESTTCVVCRELLTISRKLRG